MPKVETKAEKESLRLEELRRLRREGYTLKALGQAFGISTERARQLLLGETFKAQKRRYFRNRYVSRRHS